MPDTEPRQGQTILNRIAKASFHNTSKLDFAKLLGEPDKIAANLTAYIKAFSSQVLSAKRRSLAGTGTAPSVLAPATRDTVAPAATSAPAP